MQFQDIANTYWRNIQQTRREAEATTELSLHTHLKTFLEQAAAHLGALSEHVGCNRRDAQHHGKIGYGLLGPDRSRTDKEEALPGRALLPVFFIVDEKFDNLLRGLGG